jgi:hypothetical protein
MNCALANVGLQQLSIIRTPTGVGETESGPSVWYRPTGRAFLAALSTPEELTATDSLPVILAAESSRWELRPSDFAGGASVGGLGGMPCGRAALGSRELRQAEPDLRTAAIPETRFRLPPLP